MSCVAGTLLDPGGLGNDADEHHCRPKRKGQTRNMSTRRAPLMRTTTNSYPHSVQCMHTYIHNIHVYIYKSIYIHRHIMYNYINIYSYNTCSCLCIYVRMHIYASFIYTYIYTYIYMYVYVWECKYLCRR